MTRVTITYLQMVSAEQLCPRPLTEPRLRIAEAHIRQGPVNRFFYEFVGRSWRWVDKRGWTEEQWQAYAEDESLRTFTACYDGSPAGYYELRRDGEQGVEIAIFGLAPAFIGRGWGGMLLTHALQEAWRMLPTRVWVHTCTFDHPAALPNYQARGMQIYRVEQKEPCE